MLEDHVLIIYSIACLVLGLAVCLITGRTRPWVAQAAYSAAVLASILTAAKLSPITDGIYVSVAIGLYSMTFLLTDFLGEIHGKKEAFKAVWMAFVSVIVLLVAVYFSIKVQPAPFYENQTAFATIFGTAPRIMLASVTAFLAAQLTDVAVFSVMKERMNFLTLAGRNNVSTFVGQTIDSLVFYTIAFYGVVPDLWKLIVTTCVIKYIIAICDTPFIYLATYLAREKR